MTNPSDLREEICKLIQQHRVSTNGHGYIVSWSPEFVDQLEALVAQANREARRDELELAIQQFIFNTTSNPDNFSEYATARSKQLNQLDGEKS